MMITRWAFHGTLLLFPILSFAQDGIRTITWQPPARHRLTETKTVATLAFENAVFDFRYGKLPVYNENIKLTDPAVSKLEVKIMKPVFAPLNDEELAVIGQEEKEMIPAEIKPEATVSYMRLVPYGVVSFVPLRKNPANGNIEKLISFGLQFNPVEFKAIKTQSSLTTAAASVLASGNWYKFGITADGIYQITYTYLQQLGIDPATIDPRNIRIYGNGGGMLPLANSTFRYDDLTENSIWVAGEADGSFDPSDYILLYGRGPHTWTYDTSKKVFNHQDNVYTLETYYFLTADLGPGKRITSQPSASDASTHTVTSFADHFFYEKNENNFLKSGREWYGEEFDEVTTYPYSFSIPNINAGGSHIFKGEVCLRSLEPATFYFSLNGSTVLTLTPNKLSSLDYTNTHANCLSGSSSFSTGSSSVGGNISFAKNNAATCLGWLNYIALNVSRQLSVSGIQQVLFRDVQSLTPGSIAEFAIAGATPDVRIWEVTNPVNPLEQQFTLSGSEIRFKTATDTIREFIAFRNSGFPSPAAGVKISNQNLHALSSAGSKQPDLIIITSPLFLTQATTLAEHHRTFDNLEVVIARTDEVFNEFSSGAQDVAAVRDFIKLFYDRAQGNPIYLPKYVLLFGDGSYDFLDRIENNTNRVITYQSANSTSPTGSYVSDDFFACMDVNEGGSELYTALVDMGIGRLVAKTTEEADVMVNKIIKYATDPASQGDWRNWVCFVGDDEDNNLHIDQADVLATKVDTMYDNYNVDKIYLDAYAQVSSTGGQRYPDVERDLMNRIERGALTVNWTGHGGEVSWAHERILEVPDINAFDNPNNPPFFFTATCEFARYDDPGRTAAGELVVLHPRGGGIAALFTTRLAFANENFNLNKNFYNVVFEDYNGDFPRLGDITRMTKFNAGSSSALRNFHLLGDPAMRLAYPVHQVMTSTVNGKPVGSIPDTIKALGKVTITGYVQNRYDGTKMTQFNGVVYLTVFDKAMRMTTLVNDPYSKLRTFTLQKSIIYRGKSSVKNGEFSFTFIVPKDISYMPGYGRLSYYAKDGVTDGSGSFEEFIIGGSADTVIIDQAGPDITVYLNDENFVNGGITDENPYLLGKFYDDNGINTSGYSIGHDITAILDGNTTASIVLNDYYEGDLDSYKGGSVRYRLENLTEGSHTLRLKAFDIVNNSSEAEVDFVVAKSAVLALDHILNYPNPFTTRTSFMFEHNRPGQNLDIQVQIFTVAGKLVKTIDAIINTDGYRVPDGVVEWDGKDDYGDKIGRGVYIYRLKVLAPDGLKADQLEKLVILN